MIESIDITDDGITLKNKLFNTIIKAIGDCCSTSSIIYAKDFNKDNYINKIYKDIEKIDENINENYVKEYYRNEDISEDYDNRYCEL